MTLSHFAIFAAGLLTFASPCILPLVPVYLALLGGASAGDRSGHRSVRVFAAAVAFTLGLSLVFVLLGLAASAAGRALVAHRTLLLQLGGLAVFLFGLKLLGALQVPWLDREVRGRLAPSGGGFLSSFVLGATFALGWTPCVGPVLGSVLTLAAAVGGSPWTGALFLAIYAAGLALPLLVVAAVAPLALRLVHRMQKVMRPLQLATGVLLAAMGLLLITDRLTLLEPSALSAPPRIAALAAVTAAVTAKETRALESSGASCQTAASTAGACGLPPTALGFAEAPALPEGPAMVELVSRVCPVCLRMAPVVAAAERGCAGRRVRVRRIEVDAPGGMELARRFGVLGVPTFLFFDAKGAEVARLVGEQPLSMLEQSLSVLTGEKCGGFRALPVQPPSPADRGDAS
jgi:cytochrome c-type biogenesis protein